LRVAIIVSFHIAVPSGRIGSELLCDAVGLSLSLRKLHDVKDVLILNILAVVDQLQVEVFHGVLNHLD